MRVGERITLFARPVQAQPSPASQASQASQVQVRHEIRQASRMFPSLGRNRHSPYGPPTPVL